ncbi:acyl-CoA dehydrogenase family protein [Oceanobacillus senegalensis]|uniref:acyl-CoA dehydrogenase family protein n=1 Tax=Oceanobacillus senegalensis TaxID=1936063 RepID=UPI001FE4F2F4|nr:acyl-CoA dehydrogenase family protein [Oceanobacillus senegalensis]
MRHFAGNKWGMKMIMEQTRTDQLLDSIIKENLKPFVKKIDLESYYAKDYISNLGEKGLFNSIDHSFVETLEREALTVEKTSESCMTTGFNLWCHLAALTYLRHTNNEYLRSELLTKLEKGEILGGTGLSNPMKYFSGLEPLHLRAVRTDGGYVINGNLGAVSNLHDDHWFGVIASVGGEQEMMAFVPCYAKGLTLKEQVNYIGVNGSATYACKFKDVFVPDYWIISSNARSFTDMIRPIFVLYQIPLGLGVISASIQSMKKAPKKQGAINRFLDVQPEYIEEKYHSLKGMLISLIEGNELQNQLKELIRLRLEVDYLIMEAVHGDMLHYGGAAYLQKSHPSRRLRESYFLLNLTPTVKHLKKMLVDWK